MLQIGHNLPFQISVKTSPVENHNFRATPPNPINQISKRRNTEKHEEISSYNFLVYFFPFLLSEMNQCYKKYYFCWEHSPFLFLQEKSREIRKKGKKTET
jgi:hypothetical protein